MTTLIRSASHGNDVSIIYIKPNDFYRKISYSSVGIKYIGSEFDGISWYQNQHQNTSILKNYFRSEYYSRIDLFRIEGKQIDYNTPIANCEVYLNKCIDHYLDVWPKQKIVPCHGDLTLDNIKFNNSNPVFFDWEHFYFKGEEWGFDVAYLIISAMFFSNYKNCVFKKNDVIAFRKLWSKLCESGLSENISKRPMDYFFNVFESSDYWRNIVNNSPQKLFPVWADKEFVKYLHNITNT